MTTASVMKELKVTPVRNLTDIAFLAILINTLPLNVYFILTTIYFQAIECSYFSEYKNIFFVHSDEVKLVFED